MNIKYKRSDGKKEFVHTLNGSGLAIVYRGEDDTTAVETMSVDTGGKVVEVRVFYDHPIA